MELELLENFAFGDRKKALEGLVPGTEEYFYRACLAHEHARETAKLDALLEQWIDRHGRTLQVQQIERRRTLLRFDRDPPAACEKLRDELGILFNHQRAAGAAEIKHPTRLEAKIISRETLKRRIFARNQGTLEGFTARALEWLTGEDLSPERRGELLDRLTRPDHPRLVELVLADLGRKGVSFGSRKIHNLLTSEQLDALAALSPRLLSESKFVSERLRRVRPNEDVDLDADRRAKEEYLDRLWAFVSPLEPSFNSLKTLVLYHRLLLDRSEGTHDRALFLEYLKLPRAAHYYREDVINRRDRREHLADLRTNFPETSLPPPGDDTALVISYLEVFFSTEDNWEDFKPYLREEFLRRVFATTQLLAGRGDPQRWAEMLDDAAALQALKDRVEIELAPTNPPHYSAKDPVALAVDIKNVKTLIVKVFEIDALNYFLAYGKDVDLSVDLDGLVANQEVIHHYDESPYRRVRRELSIPELSRAGVFVVELIGNGRSSRALIRKGELRLAERIGAAGHAFTIFDEDDQPVADATMWMQGREYRARDGELIIPYSSSPQSQQVLLRRGDVSSLASFYHQAESYALSVGFYVDREQLVAHENASLLMRPQLRLNGVPVSISLLEDPVLTISSIDHSGIAATREIRELKLEDDRETVIGFLVPEGLTKLSFKLAGRVRSLSRQKDLELSKSAMFELNTMYSTNSVEAFHLAETADGWIIYLAGKTGEPRANQAVNFSFAHVDFTERFHGTLQTDAAGRIELGALEGIHWLQASSAAGVTQSWNLDRKPARFPARVHGRARLPLTAAFVGTEARLDRTSFALLEVRGGAFVHDHFDALSVADGWLQVTGLAPGNYQLVIKEHEATIELAISGGDERDGWIVSPARKLEAAERKPLGFAELDVTKDELFIQLANFDDSARAHVFAVRYHPAFRAFDSLGWVHEPQLRVLKAQRPVSSYVSGRDIGDEYRYVLERRHVPRLPGNMLPRPGLLLNPWAVRPTSAQHQFAAGGSGYADLAMRAGAPAAPAPRPQAIAGQQGDFPILDFLREPSAVIANLVPDEKGVIRVPRSKLGASMTIHVIAADETNAIHGVVRLPETRVDPRDLRLNPGLDPSRHFLVRREVTGLARGEKLVIEDVATAKLEIFDTLARAHRLLQALQPDPTLAEFAFILEWPKLDQAAKREKYSKYACHELSFFLWKKDPAFFETVIRPYLANKKDRTFLDEFLLGGDLSRWLDPWAYGTLNLVERVLLGERLPEERAPTSRHISDRVEILPPDPERDDHLFRTALSGRALEGGGGAGLAATMAPRSAIAMDGIVSKSYAGEAPAEIAAAAPMMDEDFEAELAEQEEEKAVAKRDQVRRERGRAKKSKMKDASLREENRPFYREIEKTEEWAENNYWHQRAQESLADYLPPHAFWRDYAKRDPARPFLSGHFPLATTNFTEMMFALSVLDLPFESAGESPLSVTGTRATISAQQAVIVFHEQIKACDPPSGTSPTLVGQRYLRLDDMWTYEGGEQTEKYVTGELLSQVVYVCKVVLTNPSSARQKLDVLLQIPRGAVPVNVTQRTKTEHVVLGAYATHAISYSFYFPLPGHFAHFPVHATKGTELVAAAQASPIEVIDHPRVEDTASWAHVSQHAKPEVVLQFLERENLERVDLEQIAWRFKDRAFWGEAVARLARRHKYDRTAWSYALLHGDRARAGELLRHESSYLRTAGLDLVSPIVSFEPVARAWYEHLEYAPLVHARAHRLGASRTILNDAFSAQYYAFLDLLSHRARIDDADLLEATYYLLLQDRFSEAAAMFARLRPDAVHTELQRDYLHAHLLLSEGSVEAARRLGEKHRKQPVDRWRKLFETLLAQLDEIEGAKSMVVDRDDRGQKQDQLASTDPALDFSIEGGVVTLHYQNLSSCRVSYHVMDVELLFSRQPFVQQDANQFSVVRPSRSDEVVLPAERRELSFDLPAQYASKNILVEISAGGIRRARAVYAHRMLVQAIESYGQVRVRSRDSGRPAPAAYVKAYARTKNGEVRFHKDGYTDLRGYFDYATISTGDLHDLDKVAILIVHDELGALIREVVPPKQ